MVKIESEMMTEHYQSNGYLIIPERVISTDLIRRSLFHVKAVMTGNYETGTSPIRLLNVGDEKKLQKIDHVHFSDKTLLELAAQPVIGELAAQITGANMIQVWATQLFYKPPGGDFLGNVGWHTDQENWLFWEGEVFTAWIALSEVTEESGPLTFIQGSHHWEDMDQYGDAYRQDLDQHRTEFPLPNGDSWKETSVIMEAGGVSFHQNKTLHGSGPNQSTKPRISFVINLRTEKSRAKSGKAGGGFEEHIKNLDLCPIIYKK